MKANEININRFLAQNDTQFVIPVYQRNYDWGIVQCKQLMDDILEIGKSEKIPAHFIGSIVYVHDDVYSASGIRELVIIDGQQRLTTITLIYIVIFRLAAENKNEALLNRINETYLINKFADEQEKLKLKPTENNSEALKYLLHNDKDKNFSRFSRLIENFNYFYNRIKKENTETILAGLSKLMFVEISLDRHNDDPQKIFESLNSTGLDLSQADLIRNYILMGLKSKSQNKIYQHYWEVIESNCRDHLTNESKVSDFIRDYLTLENKKIPRKDKVYEEFKLKYPVAQNVEVLEKTLIPIKAMSKPYHMLLNPSVEPDLEIRRQLVYISKLDINVAYPFLVKVYDDYQNNKLSKEQFIDVLELIQSFIWRRYLVGVPSNALNRIFMRLYEDIDIEDYLRSIEISLCSKKGSQRFPGDTEVAYALKEKDIYGMKPKNRIYFFERLENFQNKEPVKIEGNPDITIEHIFPQNPDPQWNELLGIRLYNQFKNNYLHTIANLTLSGNNGALGNKTFLEKRDMNLEGREQGYQYSRLWLNRYLRTIDHWDRETLEERLRQIKERFFSIWKIPEIPVDEEPLSADVNIFDADDPTGKKLEYAIFNNEKLEIKEVSKLYLEILSRLFEMQPQSFFSSDLAEAFCLTKERETLRQAGSISETYFVEVNIGNKLKFDKIKKALTFFGMEDELIIRYSA